MSDAYIKKLEGDRFPRSYINCPFCGKPQDNFDWTDYVDFENAVIVDSVCIDCDQDFEITISVDMWSEKPTVNREESSG